MRELELNVNRKSQELLAESFRNNKITPAERNNIDSEFAAQESVLKEEIAMERIKQIKSESTSTITVEGRKVKALTESEQARIDHIFKEIQDIRTSKNLRDIQRAVEQAPDSRVLELGERTRAIEANLESNARNLKVKKDGLKIETEQSKIDAINSEIIEFSSREKKLNTELYDTKTELAAEKTKMYERALKDKVITVEDRKLLEDINTVEKDIASRERELSEMLERKAPANEYAQKMDELYQAREKLIDTKSRVVPELGGLTADQAVELKKGLREVRAERLREKEIEMTSEERNSFREAREGKESISDLASRLERSAVEITVERVELKTRVEDVALLSEGKFEVVETKEGSNVFELKAKEVTQSEINSRAQEIIAKEKAEGREITETAARERVTTEVNRLKEILTEASDRVRAAEKAKPGDAINAYRDQIEIIAQTLEGGTKIVVAPTGRGKSVVSIPFGASVRGAVTGKKQVIVLKTEAEITRFLETEGAKKIFDKAGQKVEILRQKDGAESLSRLREADVIITTEDFMFNDLSMKGKEVINFLTKESSFWFDEVAETANMGKSYISAQGGKMRIVNMAEGRQMVNAFKEVARAVEQAGLLDVKSVRAEGKEIPVFKESAREAIARRLGVPEAEFAAFEGKSGDPALNMKYRDHRAAANAIADFLMKTPGKEYGLRTVDGKLTDQIVPYEKVKGETRTEYSGAFEALAAEFVGKKIIERTEGRKVKIDYEKVEISDLSKETNMGRFLRKAKMRGSDVFGFTAFPGVQEAAYLTGLGFEVPPSAGADLILPKAETRIKGERVVRGRNNANPIEAVYGTKEGGAKGLSELLKNPENFRHEWTLEFRSERDIASITGAREAEIRQLAASERTAGREITLTEAAKRVFETKGENLEARIKEFEFEQRVKERAAQEGRSVAEVRTELSREPQVDLYTETSETLTRTETSRFVREAHPNAEIFIESYRDGKFKVFERKRSILGIERGFRERIVTGEQLKNEIINLNKGNKDYVVLLHSDYSVGISLAELPSSMRATTIAGSRTTLSDAGQAIGRDRGRDGGKLEGRYANHRLIILNEAGGAGMPLRETNKITMKEARTIFETNEMNARQANNENTYKRAFENSVVHVIEDMIDIEMQKGNTKGVDALEGLKLEWQNKKGRRDTFDRGRTETLKSMQSTYESTMDFLDALAGKDRFLKEPATAEARSRYESLRDSLSIESRNLLESSSTQTRRTTLEFAERMDVAEKRGVLEGSNPNEVAEIFRKKVVRDDLAEYTAIVGKDSTQTVTQAVREIKSETPQREITDLLDKLGAETGTKITPRQAMAVQQAMFGPQITPIAQELLNIDENIIDEAEQRRRAIAIIEGIRVSPTFATVTQEGVNEILNDYVVDIGSPIQNYRYEDEAVRFEMPLGDLEIGEFVFDRNGDLWQRGFTPENQEKFDYVNPEGDLGSFLYDEMARFEGYVSEDLGIRIDRTTGDISIRRDNAAQLTRRYLANLVELGEVEADQIEPEPEPEPVKPIEEVVSEFKQELESVREDSIDNTLWEGSQVSALLESTRHPERSQEENWQVGQDNIVNIYEDTYTVISGRADAGIVKTMGDVDQALIDILDEDLFRSDYGFTEDFRLAIRTDLRNTIKENYKLPEAPLAPVVEPEIEPEAPTASPVAITADSEGAWTLGTKELKDMSFEEVRDIVQRLKSTMALNSIALRSYDNEIVELQARASATEDPTEKLAIADEVADRMQDAQELVIQNDFFTPIIAAFDTITDEAELRTKVAELAEQPSLLEIEPVVEPEVEPEVPTAPADVAQIRSMIEELEQGMISGQVAIETALVFLPALEKRIERAPEEYRPDLEDEFMKIRADIDRANARNVVADPTTASNDLEDILNSLFTNMREAEDLPELVEFYRAETDRIFPVYESRYKFEINTKLSAGEETARAEGRTEDAESLRSLSTRITDMTAQQLFESRGLQEELRNLITEKSPIFTAGDIRRATELAQGITRATPTDELARAISNSKVLPAELDTLLFARQLAEATSEEIEGLLENLPEDAAERIRTFRAVIAAEVQGSRISEEIENVVAEEAAIEEGPINEIVRKYAEC